MNKNLIYYLGGGNAQTPKWLLSILMAVLLCSSLDTYAKDYNWEGVKLNLTTETITHTSYKVSNQVNSDTHSANATYLASSSLSTIQSWDNFDITTKSNWNKIVFFYHPATGKWLSQGSTYGTKAHLSADYGMKCLLSMDSRNPTGLGSFGTKRYFFFVCTSAASSDGHMLSDKKFSSVGEKADNEDNPYCDATNSDDNMIAWSFIPFTETPSSCNEFGIRARYGSTKSSNHVDYEHRFITYDPTRDMVYIKWYDSDELAKADENTHWRMVTLQQIYDALSTNPSDVDDPFNVSFWLKDPQLARCNSENSSWTCSIGDMHGSNGLKFGLDNVFSGKPDGSTADSRYGVGNSGLSDNGKTQVMKNYGKYFCGEMRAYDGSTLSQSWTCVKSGWYRLSCQGFVKDGNSKLYAYINNSSGTRLDYQSEPLKDIADYDNDLNAISTDTVTTMLSASRLFVQKYYPNSLYIYCEEGNTLNFGLQFKGASAWTCFDDFELEYCGEEKVGLVLDEDKTKLDYITEAYDHKDGFKNTILHLHHTFSENNWNTIVLPVELTKSQVNRLFGEGTKVAEMTDFSNGCIQFTRTEDENTHDSEVIMKANTPYIIKPTVATPTGGVDNSSTTPQYYDAKFQYTYNSDISSLKTVTCKAPYATTRYTKQVAKDYMSSDEFGTTDLQMSNDNGTATVTKNGLSFHGTLIQTYDENQASGTDDRYKLSLSDKYIVYQNKIYHVPASRKYGIKGLRGYFSFDTPSTSAKSVKFSINGVEEDAGNVTGIDGLFEGGIANTPDYDGKVYDLSGQVVNANGSTGGLTKGIYIVKGKKVVVK